MSKFVSFLDCKHSKEVNSASECEMCGFDVRMTKLQYLETLTEIVAREKRQKEEDAALTFQIRSAEQKLKEIRGEAQPPRIYSNCRD